MQSRKNKSIIRHYQGTLIVLFCNPDGTKYTLLAEKSHSLDLKVTIKAMVNHRLTFTLSAT